MEMKRLRLAFIISLQWHATYSTAAGSLWSRIVICKTRNLQFGAEFAVRDVDVHAHAAF
jgi:hypothetical protein